MPTNPLSPTRADLLRELQLRVDDRVLEPTNAALLRKLIERADTDDEAIAVAALGTTYKRTGFHFDVRLERLTNDIRYLRRNPALSFTTSPNALTHRLIIGDNYEALQNLLIQYRGQVDVIYIDPPYGKDSMGEFAHTNYENALTRDNLLSMLYPRLVLARQLLSDTGVIFCSIDDKNQAYVKCLFDEVFGERNYVETFIWNKTSTPAALSNKSRQTHEFVLCYVRFHNKEKFNGLVNEGGDAPLLNASNKEAVLQFPANYVVTHLKDGNYSAGIKDRVELLNDITVTNGIITTPFSLKGKFRWSQSTLNVEIKTNCKLIIKSERFAIRYCREGERTVAPANFIVERVYNTDTSINKTNQNVDTNEKASRELETIFGESKFSFPKPQSLISYLISFIDNKQALILDFFAGSGTTGHAVLELNRKDGGKRKFILCQLNEKTDTTPNGIAYDVTAPRLKRIMTGRCYDGTADFPWIKDNEPYGDNLEVTEIDRVFNAEATAGKTPFDVIDETLYGQQPFTAMREKIEWVCQHFQHTQRNVENDSEWEKRKRDLDHATRS